MFHLHFWGIIIVDGYSVRNRIVIQLPLATWKLANQATVALSLAASIDLLARTPYSSQFGGWERHRNPNLVSEGTKML